MKLFLALLLLALASLATPAQAGTNLCSNMVVGGTTDCGTLGFHGTVPGHVTFQNVDCLPSTLTDAGTISVDASVSCVLNVTIGGNRTYGTPTNLSPGRTVTFYQTQDGTGSRVPEFGPAWIFPNNQVCSSPPCWSTTAGATDRFTCQAPQVSSPTYWNCTPPSLAFGPVQPSGQVSAILGCSGSSTSCTTANTFSVTSGHSLLVIMSACGDSSCTTTAPTGTISSVTTSPSSTTGCASVRAFTSGNLQGGQAFQCTVNATNAVTVTVNMSASNFFTQVDLVDIPWLATVDSVGNSANGNSAAPTVSTTGPTTQGSELIVGYAVSLPTVTGFTPPSGWTSLGDISQKELTYKFVTATGTQSYAPAIGSSGRWFTMIIPVK